jgi:hypothetical protein
LSVKRGTSSVVARVAVSAALLLAVSAFAQSKVVTFDPARDLEGFEDCMRSEFKDLYPIARYDALLGKELSAEEIEKLKLAWKGEVEQAQKEIAALRADPLGVYLHHLHQKLATDTYFSKIAWTEDRSSPPFVFIIQKPAKEDPAYAKRVLGLYLPWVQKLDQIIEALYVKPLALQRKAEPAAYAICILASQGDYMNYSRMASSDFVHVGSALELSVGYEDPFDTSASATRKRYPLLNRVARLILDSYTAPRADLTLWMASGLPAYLAYHEGLVPDSLDRHPTDDEGLALLVYALQKREVRAVMLHPVEDLLMPDDSERLAALVRLRAAAAQIKEPDWGELLRAIRVQSTLWMHFLQDADGGKYRARFLKYLQAELSGKAGPAAFESAFEGVELADLNREFYAYVLAERERHHPTLKLDRAVLENLFDDRSEKPGESAEPGDAGHGDASTDAGAPAPRTTPAFQPSTLAVAAADVQAQHGLALLRAQGGDVEGARKALQDLAAGKPTEPEATRIARDLERMSQLATLRDAYLASLLESGAKWSSEYQGKKFVAKVDKIEGGLVRLGENKAGLSAIPLTAIEPADVARQADSKSKQGGAAPWARAYAYIISGDAKWERLSRDSSPAARELYQDAKAWYPGLLRTGDAARSLDALSKSTLPKTHDEGVALMASIRALLAAASDLPLVERRIEGLRALATAAAQQSFVPEDPASMIHGSYTPIENGRVKIVYDFKKADQGLDFVKELGYMKEWGKGYAAVKLDEAQSSFDVTDGAFVGKGTTCYRYKLGFTAPIILRCTFRWRDMPLDNAAGSSLMIGMCDDGKGSHIACGGSGYILVTDRNTGYAKQSTGGTAEIFTLGQVYHLDIQNDGTEVTTFVDDQKARQASVGPLKSGGIFLWLHTDYPLDIQRFEIEGAIDPASMQRLKTEWIAKQLTELGFK